MYKYELLAPAGRPESIIPLIDAGADAIYVGLDGFSSRPKSSDFSLAEIENATRIAHENNVRLHVAINGCISENVLDELYQRISDLDAMKVDALIIADWGILSKASQFLHNSELHASTLLGTYNAHTVEYLKRFGVTRTVLSTNLYLDEIAAIVNSVPDMEYEIVAEGGICFNDNRICELPHTNEGDEYTVYCRQDYDLQTGDQINKANRICAHNISICDVVEMYLELGILSYKIEGRTADYHYVLPKVKNFKNALEEASKLDRKKTSTLHYISELRLEKR